MLSLNIELSNVIFAFIFDQVVKSLVSFGLEMKDCVGMTRDNAPNMEKAFDLGQFRDILNFPCACHSLNLVFNEVYKNKEPVARIVKQVDAIRMLFSNSKDRRELLRSEQLKLKLPQQVFPSPCITRWWSLQYVLTFFLKNHQPIANSFANKSKFKQDEIFSYSVEFLSTILEISTAMESECLPTISLIIPFLFNFTKILESDEKIKVASFAEKLCKIHLSVVNADEVRTHVEKVFEVFKECFINFKAKYLDSEFYEKLAISTLLDPR